MLSLGVLLRQVNMAVYCNSDLETLVSKQKNEQTKAVEQDLTTIH